MPTTVISLHITCTFQALANASFNKFPTDNIAHFRTISTRPFLASKTPRLLYASAWSLFDASAMRKHWYAIPESPIP